MLFIPSFNYFIGELDELIISRKMEDPLNVIRSQIKHHFSGDTLNYPFVRDEMLRQGHD